MVSQINTFEKGVLFGVDPSNQPENTLRYALNARIANNKNIPHGNSKINGETGDTYLEESLAGRTFSLSNERGTKLIGFVCEGYSIVALKYITNDKMFVVATQGSQGYAQFGIVYVNQNLDNYTYKVIFDDHNDPNQDRLRIKKYDEPGFTPLDIIYSEENEFTGRVYINDGYNEERCININLFFKETFGAKSCDAASWTTPIHTPSGNCYTSSSAYPKHMSVHNMSSRMDVLYPKIKFKKRVSGALKRGVYQYGIRMVSADGHKSIWSTITRHIVVTGTHYPSNPEYLKPVTTSPWNGNNGFSHHNRFMSSTDNDSITEDGIRLELKGLDTRWDSFEICYVYSKTDEISHEANIFYKYNSNNGTSPFSSNMIIDHVNQTGEPIVFDELNQRYETLLSQASIIEHNKRIYRLGVELIPEIVPNVSGITIEPTFRYLKGDQTLEPNFVQKQNPRTGRLDGDPLTNSSPVNTTISLSNFTGSQESYDVDEDYLSYKGQQVEHLLKGYFRGETYGIGLMFRDRKGNPLFVHHVKDYTFPEQYYTHNGESCSLTKLVNGRWELRVMGIKLSGIKIPKKCLRDKFGKLNISSFEIVRTKRSGKILHQGIVWPVVNIDVGCGDDFKSYIRNKPSPFLKNKYEIPFSEVGDFHDISPDSNGNSHYMLRDDVDGNIFSRKGDVIGQKVQAYPGYCMYASPDVFIESAYEFRDFDKLKHVGTAHKAYSRNEIPLIGSGFPIRNINKHNYAKCYNTTNQEGNPALFSQGGRPRLSSESEVRFGQIMNTSWYEKTGIDPDRTDMKFRNGYLDVGIADQSSFDLPGGGTTTHKIGYGVGVKNTLFLGCKDFKHVDIHHGDSEVSYRIVNYIRATDEYYTKSGSNSMEARVYIPTGHFQPITEAILSQVAQDADNYIFNDVEVFGGDCFVNYFGFTRTMSQAKFEKGADAAVRFRGDLEVDASCKNTTGDEDIGYRDYSYSMIVPLESKYNTALRYGRIFEAVGTMPQETYMDNNFLQFIGGINDKQQESFDINAVLLHQENIQFFSSKPVELKIVSHKYSSVYASPQKTYGEYDDSYRQQKVNDFYDLEGKGRGIAMAKAFSYVYVFQEDSYGILRTSERAIVPTSIGEVILGSGKDLDGVDYISHEIGCQHKSSVLSFENSIIWVDARRGIIAKHGQSGKEEVSENKMMQDFVSKHLGFFDNNIAQMVAYGDANIICGYNPENKDIYITFNGIASFKSPQQSSMSYTISLNEKFDIFNGFYQFYPVLYATTGKHLFAINPSNKGIYAINKGRYGEYFGEFKKTVIVFQVNKNPMVEKTLDNMKIFVDYVGQKRIGEITIDTQSSKHILKYQQNGQIVDERFKYREDKLVFPTFQPGLRLPRLRDRFFTVRIEIDNQNQSIDGEDIPVSLSFIESVFRYSSKI